ncbi:hypothetical protein N0V95_007323 [Ascochyta clinopodiicola]|nr:hypothetical protein N0V95_007323 [Ascochyta clinopodiicola]
MLFSFIDRSNIGNANIAGLSTDLHLVGTQYNVALLIFYIPYIIADVPSNWLVKRFRAGVYLPTLITMWGLVCTFMGFTKSFAGLVVCRALLGLFEGGILGGVIVGLFYCAAPLSGAFGGLLASGLSKIEVGGYEKWPWIFFVEGAATVLFGITCFFFMPDTPATARFLNDEEKSWALRRMRLDAHGATSVDVDEEKFDWYWVMMALKAPQTYFNGFIWFFLLIPLYSFSLFLPSIIAGMGYQSTTAQLLTVPPNMAAFFTVLACAYYSDRLKTRGAFIAAGTIVGAVGYIMLVAASNNATRYAGTFLVAIGVFQGSPMVIGWTSNNLAPHYVRATGVGVVISIANCSAFIDSSLNLSSVTVSKLRQLVEFIHTISLLVSGFVLPEIIDTIASFGMGVDFNPAKDIGSLEGKVILVTGGNAGLGKQTVAYLAAHKPARIYLAARTASKASSAIADIKSSVPNACDIVHLPLDLTSFSSIAQAAATFHRAETRLDILINNAGIMACPYSTTKEGYEIQFGTNHMGHALLTKLLLPTLLRTAETPGGDVRIVTLSSSGHAIPVPGGLMFDQKALEQQGTWKRYGQSKLCNLLFAREVAQRYPQITSVSLHPGVIFTDLFQSMRANVFLKAGMWIYGLFFFLIPGHFKSPEGGALNQTWAATAKKESLANGAYYKPVGVKSSGSTAARDEGLQKKLWEYTEAELGRHGY